MRRIVVIGAGIGGLTAAALLARAGHAVTVLERHVDVGGCAATFYYRRFRFDCGATLAGGFREGGPHQQVAALLDIRWPVRAVEPAMVVQLGDARIVRWGDSARWREERRRVFPSPSADRFWEAQEALADRVWSLAARRPAWPPERVADVIALVRQSRPGDVALVPHLVRTAHDVLPSGEALLAAFVDAQLLISAQALAVETIWPYAAVALDLARQGVVGVSGGIGALARTLAEALRRDGGEVLTKREATALTWRGGLVDGVLTQRGEWYPADLVLANLTPWSLVQLLGERTPRELRRRTAALRPAWGAFTLYLAVPASAVPAGTPTHYQVVADPSAPLGEGNSIFISLSPEWDLSRAPAGFRTVTISTHTAVGPWWSLDRAAYLERRDHYRDRLLAVAAQVLPAVRAATLVLPGTPRTFHRFTRRHCGFVGGLGQRSLWSSLSPRTGIPNLFLVGDSVFPGQSTAAVSLGAIRVADLAAAAVERCAA
ncbi:MAG: C-3',4' desaturase CrtD [Dehalococcoidia bacterium]|nr:MAG: C-3',4' desaturase CrtD [Dehalococcoidia bacterium]